MNKAAKQYAPWVALAMAVISGGWTYLHNLQDAKQEQGCIEEIRRALEFNSQQWQIALEISQGKR